MNQSKHSKENIWKDDNGSVHILYESPELIEMGFENIRLTQHVGGHTYGSSNIHYPEKYVHPNSLDYMSWLCQREVKTPYGYNLSAYNYICSDHHLSDQITLDNNLNKNYKIYRYDIINTLIKHYNYKTYLEIGTRDGECISKIDIQYKTGVAPLPSKEGEKYTDFKIDSLTFFEKHENKNFGYDIIFIDGSHIGEIVLSDILNSLDHLNEGGTIVMHDCNPQLEIHQRQFSIVPTWNGTTWKAFANLRCNRKDLQMVVVDTDNGVGIIQKGEQKPFGDGTFDFNCNWEFLDKHRKNLLNLISVDEFHRKYDKN